jgi:hypothetical protein
MEDDSSNDGLKYKRGYIYVKEREKGKRSKLKR